MLLLHKRRDDTATLLHVRRLRACSNPLDALAKEARFEHRYVLFEVCFQAQSLRYPNVLCRNIFYLRFVFKGSFKVEQKYSISCCHAFWSLMPDPGQPAPK